MYVYVRVFNAPPTLNFILHTGAARYTAPGSKKKMASSLDTFCVLGYFIASVNTLVDHEKSFDFARGDRAEKGRRWEGSRKKHVNGRRFWLWRRREASRRCLRSTFISLPQITIVQTRERRRHSLAERRFRFVKANIDAKYRAREIKEEASGERRDSAVLLFLFLPFLHLRHQPRPRRPSWVKERGMYGEE